MKPIFRLRLSGVFRPQAPFGMLWYRLALSRDTLMTQIIGLYRLVMQIELFLSSESGQYPVFTTTERALHSFLSWR